MFAAERWSAMQVTPQLIAFSAFMPRHGLAETLLPSSNSPRSLGDIALLSVTVFGDCSWQPSW
eukprot:12899251-Prorocentrum_lima.AAC.1